MSLIPTVYRSTDPGAPVLSGTAGSFAALMDAVLVNGYGTGPDAKPGLGWVLAFSDGHKRAYQNNLAEGGTGMFWRIDDSNAQYVLNSAFHTMSGIDTGVDGFGGTNNAWGKSITANTTARSWVVVGNSRSCYVFIACGQTSGSYLVWVAYFVGDYECVSKSYKFNYAISVTAQATVTTGLGNSSLLWPSANASITLMAARSYDAAIIGAPMKTRPHLLYPSQNNAFGTNGYGGLPYPYPPTGGLIAAKLLVDNNSYMFGAYPGGWATAHTFILPTWTVNVFSDGSLDGDFLSIESHLYGQRSQGLIELNRPWDY